MLLHNWRFSSTSSRLLQSTSQSKRIDYEAVRVYSRRREVKVSSTLASLRVGTDVIVEIAHNKALIAATACAAIGQLAKPFTGFVFYRREFDPKSVFQAGGFPSTHSSAAVATAMSIGLERGFSDSVFGLAVVFAALTMYDAQGVRREVGVHAKTLNKVLTNNQPNTYSSSNTNRSIKTSSKNLSSNSNSINSLKMEKTINASRVTDDVANSDPILKESIGHTEIEVAAGALLGLLTSLAIYSL